MLILCISFCVCIIAYVYLYLVVFVVFFVFCRSSFSTLILLVGLLTCKNRLPYNLYCVGGDVKHCSLTHASHFCGSAGTGRTLEETDVT